MEVTVKMNAQEALATVEKGTLAKLIKSAESELEEKPAKPETLTEKLATETLETPTPRPVASDPRKLAPTPRPMASDPRKLAPAPRPMASDPRKLAPAPQPEKPATETPETPAPQAPVSAVSYSADDLQKAAIGLMDAGKQPELIALLRSFGVEALPALPQDKYDAFALKLRELGARI